MCTLCVHIRDSAKVIAANKEKSVNFREFRNKLSEYLRQARQGAAFVVTSRGEQLARIGPPPLAPRPRSELLGLFRGRLRMAADFDETPGDIIDAMEHDV